MKTETPQVQAPTYTPEQLKRGQEMYTKMMGTAGEALLATIYQQCAKSPTFAQQIAIMMLTGTFYNPHCYGETTTLNDLMFHLAGSQEQIYLGLALDEEERQRKELTGGRLL